MKPTLRRAARQRRGAMPVPLRRYCARRIAYQFLRQRKLLRARHVAIYVAQADELDTAPVIRSLQARHVQTYAPIMWGHARGHRIMRFVPLRASTPLRCASYGIREPVDRTRQQRIRQLDVVLVPLLAFDAHGGRLGQGGGYYDRCFARRSGHRPLLVGYAYHAQRVAALPLDAWDVRLDAILTERGLYWCRP